MLAIDLIETSTFMTSARHAVCCLSLESIMTVQSCQIRLGLGLYDDEWVSLALGPCRPWQLFALKRCEVGEQTKLACLAVHLLDLVRSVERCQIQLAARPSHRRPSTSVHA